MGFAMPNRSLSALVLVVIAGCGDKSKEGAATSEPVKTAASADRSAAPGKTAAKVDGTGKAPEAIGSASLPAPQKPVDAKPGPAYVAVAGVGLVRIDVDGTSKKILDTKYTVKDLDIAPDGGVFATGIEATWRIEGDKVKEISKDGADAIAALDGGKAVTVSFKGVHTYDGKAWSNEDKTVLGDDVKLIDDVDADAQGNVYVLSTHFVHKKTGTTWTKLDASKASGRDQQFFKQLAHGPEGSMFVTSSNGVFVLTGDQFTKTSLGKSIGGASKISVAPTGEVAAISGLDDLYVAKPGGGAFEISPKSGGFEARSFKAIAVDAGGRKWIATDNGLVVLDADNKLVQQWKPGTLPDVNGTIEAMLVVGGGPALPKAQDVVAGNVSGKVIRGGSPVATVDIEICESPSTFFKTSPCDDASFKKAGKTNEKGEFTFEGVPIGTYSFAVKGGDKWAVMIGSNCCSDMKKGQTYDVGSIELKK